MHVTTKETDDGGAHVLTSIIEGDGAVALASDKAEIVASVLSASRTDSGGIQVKVAVTVKEPAAPPAAPSDPKDQAIAYFVEKGFTTKDAAAQVEHFGADRVLAQKAKEEAEKQAAQDKELEALLAGK